MSRSLLSASVKTLVVGLALAASTQIHAATPAALAQKETTVYFGDLDLESQAGAELLLHRLTIAAEKVCNVPTILPGNMRTRGNRIACRNDAVQAAVVDVDNAHVTAIYNKIRPVKMLAMR